MAKRFNSIQEMKELLLPGFPEHAGDPAGPDLPAQGTELFVSQEEMDWYMDELALGTVAARRATNHFNEAVFFGHPLKVNAEPTAE